MNEKLEDLILEYGYACYDEGECGSTRDSEKPYRRLQEYMTSGT